MWPETTYTAPNSPIARALHRMMPYSRPYLMFGSVMRRKICQPRAPRLTPATSSSEPIASITGSSSRATKGKVTKAVARIRPGVANTTFRSCSRSHGPSSPCNPKISINARPATTGETAKGRSIIAVNSVRPRKRKRAIAQAAARPKITLSTTAVGATIIVRRMDESVSGSPTSACQ